MVSASYGVKHTRKIGFATILFIVTIVNFASAKNETTTTPATKPDLKPKEESRQYGTAPASVKYLITSLKNPGQRAYLTTTSTPVITYEKEISYSSAPVAQPAYQPQQQTYQAAQQTTTTVQAAAPQTYLGDTCTGYADCASVRGATCVSGLCSCGQGTVPLSNIGCVPVAQFFGDSCVITAQCKTLDPLATCYQDICICEPIYHAAGSAGGGASYGAATIGGSQGRASITCLRKQKLGEGCSDNVQCAYNVWNSVCSGGVCACNTGYVGNGPTQCAPVATALGQTCANDAQCWNIMFAVCGRSGTCECPDAVRYVTTQGSSSDRRKRQIAHGTYAQMCMPAEHLGHACMSGLQCSKKTKHSDCIGGICSCVTGYVQRDPQVNECLPKIMAFGPASPPCTISAQCMLPNTFCNQTIDRCDCSQFFCSVGGTCLGPVAWEQPCQQTCQCTTNGAVCLSGWCQCKDAGTFVPSINICTPRVLRFASRTFEFTGRCCQNTAVTQCVGQLLVDQAAQFFPPYTISLSSSVTAPTFTVDTNGAIFMADSPALTATATLTAIITASGQNDTAVVLVKPDPCCTLYPFLTSTTSMTVPLITNSAAGNPCIFISGTPSTILNDFEIPVASLFNEPCGQPLTFSVTGTSSNPAASCVLQNGLLGITTTTVGIVGPFPSSVVCTFAVTATSCTGLQTTTSTMVTYICP